LNFLQSGALKLLEVCYTETTRREKRLRSSSSETSFHITTSLKLSSFRAENQKRKEVEELQL